MGGLPDPDRYLDHVLVHAEPGVAGVVVGPIAEWESWWAAQLPDAAGLTAPARGQGFVLTTAQLRAAGMRDHDLRREVRRGTWWVPARGTASPVVPSGSDFLARRRGHALRGAAATLLRPDHGASGATAATMHGLPTMAIPNVPELTSRTPDWLGRRSASHLRSAALAADDVTTWHGAPLTTMPRTIVDLGRHDRRSAIMAVDAALRERRVNRAQLAVALERARGWPGVRQARELVALADEDAESPLESITRLALYDDGFPPPKLQQRVAGYRVDFLWPEQRLILEADGRVKYSGDEGWEEKKRLTALRRAGYEVERVLWLDVVREWPAMSARLRPYFLLPRPSRHF